MVVIINLTPAICRHCKGQKKRQRIFKGQRVWVTCKYCNGTGRDIHRVQKHKPDVYVAGKGYFIRKEVPPEDRVRLCKPRLGPVMKVTELPLYHRDLYLDGFYSREEYDVFLDLCVDEEDR